MKAADIPDEAFIAAVRSTPGTFGSSDDDKWRMRWEVKTTLQATLGHDIPEKVFLAKAKRLMARGLLGGCDCGCRGDYHIPQPQSDCCNGCDAKLRKTRRSLGLEET